jgi:activator of 2-hydroxyglutaryl-CoA dehydratase/predicted nucleotide-binding protein (sugar kinase/HSP70/actin superfamily)
MRVAGCDLGKATAKLVVAEAAANGAVGIVEARVVTHDGRPFDALSTWVAELRADGCAALGVTGLHAQEVGPPALGGLPEDACLEAGLQARTDLSGPLRLVSIGARGYSVLARDSAGRVTFLENDKCSSGLGETMVKIASRFGLGIEDADRLARGAATSVPITARCSVFAKSEMTHFGNQGRPIDQLFRGYFESVARTVATLLARTRAEGPVLVVGGGSRIATVVDALRDLYGGDVRVPEGALLLEALGAAALAAEQARAEGPAPLPEDPAAMLHVSTRRFAVLGPARDAAWRVRRLEPSPVPPEAKHEPSILGLDLGSTGSKAVLTSVATGEAVLDLYDRTRGNPVEAAMRLTLAVLAERPDVRALAVTGSGREAVATVLRAAFPEAADRVVVHNEIVAHATAAIRCDEHGGKSLSVVEIGGQDAKFIQIVGGQIVESDMNKACSAGTGSFLEEQAQFYGVHDITELTRLATEAGRPPDLGQMCTVFVADAAAEAEREGASLADLFAGFQYSVIHNYVNRVMGERSFGERIFFQGKPASGPSLAWTLAAVTGREVTVPPNPGAMGAWGIALCALAELGAARLAGASTLDLSIVPAARVLERGEIRCQDPRCATYCRIDRTVVAVGLEKRSVLSGGACPKFELSSAGRPKLPVDAPIPFEERERALAPFLAGRAGPAVLAVPHVGALAGTLPFVVTLLSELGLGVKVLRGDAGALSRGEERTWSYDACAPVKIAHAVADGDADVLFFPKVTGVTDREGPGGRTCAMEQGLPEMVARSLAARGRAVRLVAPRLDLREGDAELGAAVAAALADLRVDPLRVPQAVRAARAAQDTWERDLAAIGARALAWGRAHGVPAVLVCGPQHVLHDPVVSAGIPGILRQNGVLAVPMDCLPVSPGTPALPRVVWGDSNRALRAALTARTRGDVYPLLLSSFGCGPASFTEHFFHMLLEGHPHTALESDGHGGGAGYVTRVQAFLHTVRQHDGRATAVPEGALRRLEPLPDTPITDERGSRLVALTMSDRFSALLAAVYRSFGFDAVPTGPSSAESLATGRRDCSGKECLPYQLLWGSFRRHLEEHPPDRRTVLLQVSGDGACRNCMFSVKDQISLGRMGLEDKVAVRHLRPEAALPIAFVTRIWATIVAWDLLHQMALYHRAGEVEPGASDRLYAGFCGELETLVARPARTGALGHAAEGRELAGLLERAAQAFASLPARPGRRRTVLLTGDVYVRVDDFASDGLARRLAERGLHVLLEPLSILGEYAAAERSSDLLGLPTGLVENAAYRVMMATIRRALVRRVQRHHPWLPMPSVGERIRASREVIARHPIGEAPITVGSVLHAWRDRQCDGVVVVSPWGCGPALVAESLLRHEQAIPLLFVYTDGSPIDERRLNGFAFRLRRAPARTGAVSTSRATARRPRVGRWCGNERRRPRTRRRASR